MTSPIRDSGDLHQDFVYASFVSADLTGRVVDAYERLTARTLDRRRIAVLTGVLRLWELAEEADDPAARATMLAAVEAWGGRAPPRAVRPLTAPTRGSTVVDRGDG